MKHIYLNLKRFDISPAHGGVNRLSTMVEYGAKVVKATQEGLLAYARQDVEFVMYLPEAHLLGAVGARTPDSPVQIGCQGVHRADTAVGGAFGAFTSLRTANAVKEMGCSSVLIGHCEERGEKLGVLDAAGMDATASSETVNRLLNQEIKASQAAGLSAVYCIGERSEEQAAWQEVLSAQLRLGLEGVDCTRVVIAYEPIWSIGPGKTPADKPYITKVARFIKEITDGLDVVYGGGLKQENAAMLASIHEIDGGLIALTRFSGEIGFYPEEYLQIIAKYLG